MKSILLLLAIVAIAGCIGQQASPTGSVAGNLQSGIDVGNIAMDFSLAEIDGDVMTLSDLRGKPLFIFFTTTWCVPCQVGASQLARYDTESGDAAFNVLIIFVDKSETKEDLRRWKARFGNPDWLMTLDSNDQISKTYKVQYLDTKYVLDGDGIIRWKDVSSLTYETAKQILAPLCHDQCSV